MFITRKQWDHLSDPSLAPVLREVLRALNLGLKVTVKDAGQPPYREFSCREEFEAAYRKKLRARPGD